MNDIKQNLRDLNIHVGNASYGNVKAKCPKCGDRTKHKGKKDLSVNIDTGEYKCHNDGQGCGFQGVAKPKQEKKQPVKPTTGDMQPLTDNAVKWLEDRCISKETAETLGYKTAMPFMPQEGKRVPAVAIPFYKNGEIVNIKYRALNGKSFSQMKGGEQCMYNYDQCEGKDWIVLTEGELDTAAVLECGFKGGVCSCPSGAAAPETMNMDKKLAWVDDAESIFSNAKYVILAMDNDEAGIPWQKQIAEKIGIEKCFTVEWSAGCKDANDVLVSYGPEVVAECLKLKKPMPCPGIVTIGDKWDEVENYLKRGGKALGYETGFEKGEGDATVRIDTSTLNIVTGIPGHGKSEVLDQLIVNTCKKHKWKWAVFSPENWPLPMHYQKLAEKFMGKPLFTKHITSGMTRDEMMAAKAWIDEHIKFISFGEESPTADQVISKAKVCRKLYGCNALLLDPYNELSHERGGISETEYINELLSRMRNFGRVYDISTWLVAHPTKLQKKDDGTYPIPSLYDIAGSAHFRNKADLGLSIYRNVKAKDNTVKVMVQKVRNKEYGAPGEIQMKWDWKTGILSPA